VRKRDEPRWAPRRYVNGGTVPKSIGKGRFLFHNRVRRTVDMPCGVLGFRAWTDTSTRGWRLCNCGWAGLPHYSGFHDYVCEPGGWEAWEAYVDSLPLEEG
jgi:hypothetical protein